MLQRLIKLKRLWKLSNQNLPVNQEQEIALMANNPQDAVYVSPMTEEEHQSYVINEELGWKGFIDKAKKILK